MIVRARHAAILRHLPARGRKERVDVLATVIDAEIPDVPGHAFRSLGLPDRAPDLLVRDGAVWEHLRTPRRDDGPTQSIHRDDVLAWVAGEERETTRHLDARFRRTPLVAVVGLTKASGWVDHGFSRGEPITPKSREVLIDGRARAAAAAAGFLRDDLAVVGDAVYARCSLLAELYPEGDGARVTLAYAPHANFTSGLPVALDARDAAHRLFHEPGGLTVPDEVRAVLDAVGPGYGPGEDMRYYANVLPGEAVQGIDAIALGKRQPKLAQALDGLRGRLLPFADAAAIGALREEEWADAIDLSLQAGTLMRAQAGPAFRVGWHRVLGLMGSGIVSSREAPVEDIDAMSELAP